MLACADSDSAQANTVRSRIFCEFLRENDFLGKTVFACLSGAQMASIHEKKNAKKSCVSLLIFAKRFQESFTDKCAQLCRAVHNKYY